MADLGKMSNGNLSDKMVKLFFRFKTKGKLSTFVVSSDTWKVLPYIYLSNEP